MLAMFLGTYKTAPWPTSLQIIIIVTISMMYFELLPDFVFNTLKGPNELDLRLMGINPQGLFKRIVCYFLNKISNILANLQVDLQIHQITMSTVNYMSKVEQSIHHPCLTVKLFHTSDVCWYSSCYDSLSRIFW
jgi:branched-subunit amino acid transport protein AzlD